MFVSFSTLHSHVSIFRLTRNLRVLVRVIQSGQLNSYMLLHSDNWQNECIIDLRNFISIQLNTDVWHASCKL